MDLLKYLEPMKNLPGRFSNLAFWRDVRKFKDDVVNAFKYVDTWGKNIETTVNNVKVANFTGNQQMQLTIKKNTVATSNFLVLGSGLLYVSHVYDLQGSAKLPTQYGATICVSVTFKQGSTSVQCLGFVVPTVDSGLLNVTANNLIGKIPSGSIDPTSPLTITNAYIYYNPTK